MEIRGRTPRLIRMWQLKQNRVCRVGNHLNQRANRPVSPVQMLQARGSKDLYNVGNAGAGAILQSNDPALKDRAKHPIPSQ